MTIHGILGIQGGDEAAAKQSQQSTGREQMFQVPDPGGQKFGQINATCAAAGSGCGHTFDLKAGRKDAIKFSTDTLHIRYSPKQETITHHWDGYNIHVHPILHIAVDTIWNFLRGGDL